MTNSYYADRQSALLGGLLTSEISFNDLNADDWTVLRDLKLDQSAEELFSLLDGKEWGGSHEILTASFLGDVAANLAARLEKSDFPADTPPSVLSVLADALQVKSGLVGDEIDKLEEYADMMNGYMYENSDIRMRHLSDLREFYEWLLDVFYKVGSLVEGRIQPDEQRIAKRFSFWQAAGYTADYLYLEGLSDELMGSSFLKETIREDLSNLQAAPENCRSLIARTVRLCNVVDQDGSTEKAERLERIDNVILDNKFNVPMSEWDFVSLSEDYLAAYMKIRAGVIRLNDVDGSLLDERICRCAVYTCPDDLAFVPASFISMDMADFAVSCGSSDNLQYIPRSLQTPEQVALAVSRDPMAIRFVNPGLVTFEMASSVVLRNGLVISLLPLDNFDRNQRVALVQLALVQNPQAIEYIPHSMLVPEIMAIAVRRDYTSFAKVPVCLRTADMMLYMLFVNPCLGEYVPKRLLSDPVFMQKAALIDNGWKEYALPIEY